jgi:hypothetical protein
MPPDRRTLMGSLKARHKHSGTVALAAEVCPVETCGDSTRLSGSYGDDRPSEGWHAMAGDSRETQRGGAKPGQCHASDAESPAIARYAAWRETLRQES